MLSKILLQFPSGTTQSGTSLFREVGGTEPPQPLAFQRGSAGPGWIRASLGTEDHSSPIPVIPGALRKGMASVPAAPGSPFISPGRIHHTQGDFPWDSFDLLDGNRSPGGKSQARPWGGGGQGGPWPWISELGAQRSCKDPVISGGSEWGIT